MPSSDSTEAIDLDLKLEIDIEETYKAVESMSVAPDDNDPNKPSAAIHQIAAPALHGPEQLAVIVAHENRESAQQLKSILEQTKTALQLHRVTSLEDLKGSLLAQDWHIVCGFDDSSEFDTDVIARYCSEFGNGAAAFYIRGPECQHSEQALLNMGYSDYLTSDQPLRIANSMLREALAVENARLIRSSEQLLNEINTKNALLLDANADAIAYVADGMIMHGNQALVELLQCDSIDDLNWESFIDFVAADSCDPVKNLLRQFARGDSEQSTLQAKLLSKEQTEISCELVLATASHDGEPCIQVLIHNLAPLGDAQRSAAADSSDDKPAAEQDKPANLPSNLEASNPDTSSQQNNVASATGTDIYSASALQAALTTAAAESSCGYVLLVHSNNDALLKAAQSIEELTNSSQQLQDSIYQWQEKLLLPPMRIAGASWVMATAGSDDDAIESFAKELYASSTKAADGGQSQIISIGIAQYGVADIEALDALAKAFDCCTEQSQQGGGIKRYTPRLGDNQSSSALLAALELNRLSIRYQPVIGLQGQDMHFYEAIPYMQDDDGNEQPALDALRTLGIDEENTRLDNWAFEQILGMVNESASSDNKLCVAAPVTASAVLNKNFFPDLVASIEKSGLNKSSISFVAHVDFAGDYLEKTSKLFSLLRQAGFKTMLAGVAEEHARLVAEIKPCYAELAAEMTDSTTENWQKKVKQFFDAAKVYQSECIVGGISSAADLAQIWQCGAPFIKGSYLQEPLNALNYEFSDLA